MTQYTHKDSKNLENWMFHNDYFTDDTRFLPQSIQRELVKRLTECARNPMTNEDLKSINPIIEVKLASICDAYRNKQARSRVASAKKRQPKAAAAEEESESEESEEEEEEEEDKHIEFKNFMSEFRTRMRMQRR